jgi:predicted alpha/beta superfamily hydrolase
VNETRRINIWTPPNYNQTTDSLPILYMPDGGLKEDFPHIANTLDTLIKQNKIPPYILVGIENTVRRRDLSGPSKVEYDLKHFPEPGGAENFRGFIKNELFPIIDKKYRTSGKKAIIGESAAGLFVIETFMLAPDMFDNYIAMDPALWFTTAVWQNGGFSAKFNGSSSIELLYKTEHLCFDFRHFAKLQTVICHFRTTRQG